MTRVECLERDMEVGKVDTVGKLPGNTTYGVTININCSK